MSTFSKGPSEPRGKRGDRSLDFDWKRRKIFFFIRPWISPGFSDLPTGLLYTTAHGEIECVKIAKLNETLTLISHY